MKRDVILFCIDCSESMLKLYDDPKYEDVQTCHLYTALEAAMQIQKKKIIVGPNDSVGILLFNTVRYKPCYSVLRVTLWYELRLGSPRQAGAKDPKSSETRFSFSQFLPWVLQQSRKLSNSSMVRSYRYVILPDFWLISSRSLSWGSWWIEKDISPFDEWTSTDGWCLHKL